MAKRAAQRSRVYAVVKANAYGHGVDRVARALPQADGFATLELNSAVALRDRRITSPVLLLEGFFEASELRVISSSALATVIHNEEQLRMLELDRPDRLLDVWLKINTGMNRLGFSLAEAPGALERVRASGATKSIILMTHFATSDGPPGVDEALTPTSQSENSWPRGKDVSTSYAPEPPPAPFQFAIPCQSSCGELLSHV